MKRTITITLDTPPDFYEMQDWLGQAAEPLEVIAEAAVWTYLQNGYALYMQRPKVTP